MVRSPESDTDFFNIVSGVFALFMFIICEDYVQPMSIDPIKKKWLFGQVLWHINLCRLFNTKSIFMQMISSISNYSV